MKICIPRTPHSTGNCISLTILLSVLLVSFTIPSHAGILEEVRGYSSVDRSLNKEITVTQRRTWTSYTGPETGVSVIVRPCPIIPRGYRDAEGNSLSSTQRRKIERLQRGSGVRNDLVYCRRKNPNNNFWKD